VPKSRRQRNLMRAKRVEPTDLLSLFVPPMAFAAGGPLPTRTPRPAETLTIPPVISGLAPAVYSLHLLADFS
jgi:hypothetical protein